MTLHRLSLVARCGAAVVLAGCTATPQGTPGPQPTPTGKADHGAVHPPASCSHDLEPPFGDAQTSRELERRVRPGVGEQEADTLTDLERRQLFQAARHAEWIAEDESLEEDFDLVWDLPSDGRYEIQSLEYDGQSFDWIRWDGGGNEVGLIFRGGTIRPVAAVGDGDLMGCEGRTCSHDMEPPFGHADTSDDLESWIRPGVGAGDEDTLTDLERRQLFQAARQQGWIAEGESLEEDFDLVWDLPSDGRYEMQSLEYDGQSFDWIRWDGGGNEVGVVFEDGSTRVVATVDDGDLEGCESSPSSGEDPSEEDPSEEDTDTCSGGSPFGDANTSGALEEQTYTGINLADKERLTELEQRQIFKSAQQYGHDWIRGDFEEDFIRVWDIPDTGRYEILTLEYDGHSLDWIRYYVSGKEHGSIFRDGTTELVAQVEEGGDVVPCENGDCSYTWRLLYGTVDSTSELTGGIRPGMGAGDMDTLTEIERRQIFAAASQHGALGEGATFDGDLARVWDVPSSGRYGFLDLKHQRRSFDWIRFEVDGRELGAIFKDDSTDLVARVMGGEVVGCE